MRPIEEVMLLSMMDIRAALQERDDKIIELRWAFDLSLETIKKCNIDIAQYASDRMAAERKAEQAESQLGEYKRLLQIKED